MPVAQGLEDGEANRVVVSLERGGIAANKVVDRQNDKLFRVTVLESAASSAMALLTSEGPEQKPSAGLLESLGDGALIASPRTEQLRFLAGIAGELERSLGSLDGVRTAKVHLAVPFAEPFAEPGATSTATASVLLRHRADQPTISVAEIQQLVAGAVTGLAPERVSVVLKPVSSSAPLAPTYTRVGPLLVARASAAPLRWVLAGALLANVALACGVLWLWAKHRRLTASQLAPDPD